MRAPGVWALSSGIIGLVATVLYIGIIVGEGDNSPLAIAPWVLVMSAAVICAFYGSLGPRESLIRPSLQISTVIFGLIGILGIFTIGLPFLIAAVCSAIALTRSSRPTRPPP